MVSTENVVICDVNHLSSLCEPLPLKLLTFTVAFKEEKSKYKQDDSQLLLMLGLYSAVYMNTMNNDFFEVHLNGITIDSALQFSVSV